MLLLGSPGGGIHAQLHVLNAHQRTGCFKLVATAKVSMIITVWDPKRQTIPE